METQRKTFQNCPNIRVLHKEGKNRTNIFISFIIVEFSFHAEKKKFIVWRSENLFSCPRAGKQAVFQL